MNESLRTVFVVDDDEAVRDALTMLLNAADLRVEAFSSPTAFLKAYRPDACDCLVLDIRMPGMSGLELQDEMAKRRIAVPIIFLTGHADVPIAVRALKKGAFDFIEKPIESQRLVLAVFNALRFHAERRGQLLPEAAHPDPVETRLTQLSEREREVLGLVLKGKPSKQIAAELSITLKTVEFHRARIREKLGVGSLAELFKLLLSN